MKSINLSIIIIFIFFSTLSLSQQKLYIPENKKSAYLNETRSYNGEPGENYWQNRTDYEIKVNVKPYNRLVEGKEDIKYFNNSPDTLKQIVFKLYQNFYKKGAVRNSIITPETITDGIVLEKISAGNSHIDLNDKTKVNVNGTNLILTLDEPVAPESVLTFSIDWHFTIPEGTNIRMGTYDSTTFFIGYWYPKIAVYDDIDGWDIFQYDGEHEFYNEYGSFDVEIKMPEGFGVWATGELQNAKQILNEKFYNRLNEAAESDSIIKIISKNDLTSREVYKSLNGFVTWKYYADYVPDFAFGISDHYLWDAASAEVEEGRRVVVNSVYNPDSEFFYEVADIARETLRMFTTVSPKFPYPYPQITVFNGDGGMEYPMIVNDGVFNSRVSDIYVTTHEMSHMYFPFFVGTNETKYMWMDEGMAYMIPYDIQLSFIDYDHRIRAANGLARFSGNEFDIPLAFPTYSSTGTELTLLSYYKGGVSFDMLKDALGDKLYYKALHEFINRWRGKHPTPYDFYYTFNDVTGEDLSYFWIPWYLEKTSFDLGLKDVVYEGNKITFTVEKIGNAPLPVYVYINLSGRDKINIYKNASVWSDGKKEFTIEKIVDEKIVSIKLGNNKIPDSNLINNEFMIE